MKFIQCVQNANEQVNIQDTIYAIKNAGFDGVFIQWYDDNLEFSQQPQVDLCRQLGLSIEFCHLGYSGINNLWTEGVDGDNLVTKYIRNLQECKDNNINLVIMHLCSKYVAPPPSLIGIKRLKAIVQKAEELEIKIAFENTKLWGYLEYVFDNIKSENIGVCLDSGHLHCHFDNKYSWDRFKNKIFALHLHDNDKSKDQHLLPFDGTIDWKDLCSKIKLANYTGPLTLESCYKNNYTQIPLTEFYINSMSRAKDLFDIYNK